MPAEKIQPDSAHRVEGRKGFACSAAGVLGGTEGTSTPFYEKGVINMSPVSPLTE